MLVLSFNTWLTQGSLLVFLSMATNNGSPHLQIRHNLSGLYLPDWKWLHPIVIALTHCAQCSFSSNGVWHFTELIGAHTLKN